MCFGDVVVFVVLSLFVFISWTMLGFILKIWWENDHDLWPKFLSGWVGRRRK